MKALSGMESLGSRINQVAFQLASVWRILPPFHPGGCSTVRSGFQALYEILADLLTCVIDKSEQSRICEST